MTNNYQRLIAFAYAAIIFSFNYSCSSKMATSAKANSNMSIIADGATLQLLSNQFSFTEGPAADADGNVYFTDQPNDKIWKYSTDGKLTIFLDRTGRSNGLYFDKKGNLIACADENNQLWQIGPDKKISVLVNNFKGQKLNGPNDLWIDAKAGIYITDPYYQRPYWQRTTPEISGEKVYYLPPATSELMLASDNFKKPNGIIGTPDGKQLYVADIGDNKTYRFDINSDGTLSNQKVFVHQGSDGMTIDERGNIYLTGDGVTVYNKDGEKIEHIAVPAKWTANVTFGGKEKNTLFITASENVFMLRMKTKGAN